MLLAMLIPGSYKVADDVLLHVKDLKMYFPVTGGIFRRKVADIKAIDGVSFKIKQGETLGLVGESGCGKTTAGRCVLRIYRPNEGQIFFEGRDISQLPLSAIRSSLSKMSLVFQDPYASLNPRQRAGGIVGEPLKVRHATGSSSEYKDRVEHLFRMVGLDPRMTDHFPHEFSGGQRQRIGIARALACEPSLIICDEPISALDVSIQAQILNLLKDLQVGLKGLTYLLIAHDLSVVRHMSNRIAVMYLGRIVEITDSRTLYDNSLHPYTQALISAVPVPNPVLEATRQRIILKGEVPSALNPPPGCHFHPRCPVVMPECSRIIPPLRNVGGAHDVACLRVK